MSDSVAFTMNSDMVTSAVCATVVFLQGGAWRKEVISRKVRCKGHCLIPILVNADI